MANINAQSVEDLPDRIIYRYPAGRYQQTPTNWVYIGNPGLTTLVNTQTSRSYVIPASGISAKLFKIEWVINTFAVFDAGSNGLRSIKYDFARIVTPSPALNYDGKTLQTEFYEKKTENFYTSPQLRSINISDIQVEPMFDITNIAGAGAGLTAVLDFNLAATTFYMAALMQPTVTFYKK